MSSNEEKIENVDKAGEGCGHRGKCGGRRRYWKMPFIFAAIVLIKSGLVLFIWNLLIPDLFHGPMLTYLQAIELVVLVKLLTGGHHRHGGFGRHHHMKHRWMSMTKEEREKLRDDIKNRG